MFVVRCSLALVAVAIILTVVIIGSSEAAYRKPPFNGSIFGKRNNIDYDNAKAITAMCEIAMETCQAWFPPTDSK